MNMKTKPTNKTIPKKAIKVVGPTRQDRGRRIIENGGQVRRIDEYRYEVQSQTWGDRTYEVIHTEHGWLCSCPDSIEAGHHCKHAHAVEMSISMRDAVRDGITVAPVDPTKCKHCGRSNIAKDCIVMAIRFAKTCENRNV